MDKYNACTILYIMKRVNWIRRYFTGYTEKGQTRTTSQTQHSCWLPDVSHTDSTDRMRDLSSIAKYGIRDKWKPGSYKGERMVLTQESLERRAAS